MNLKAEAAKKAVTLISDQSTIGLGEGSTIAYLAGYLIKEVGIRKLSLKLLTSSFSTQQLLNAAGLEVMEINFVSSLDWYFDGCDQVDKDLNALKSGAGIHTREKLMAAMATEFVIVADESKYCDHFSTKFPLVLELIPEALGFVTARVKKLFPSARIEIRMSDKKDRVVLTSNGNYLLDLWFESWPELRELNPCLKNITGVLETSLFFNMANKAIIAGSEGVRIFNDISKSI
jgi:ribose 5-phosphate isomerase A